MCHLSLLPSNSKKTIVSFVRPTYIKKIITIFNAYGSHKIDNCLLFYWMRIGTGGTAGVYKFFVGIKFNMWGHTCNY